MASSRWKRFAFFERQALNLPGEVLDDLIPPEDGSNAGQAGGGSSRPHRSLRSLLSSSSGGTGGPQQPPPNALTPAGPAVGDLVSLVVTTAALPTSTRSAGGYGKAGMVSDDAAAAALAARRDTAAAVASSSSSSNQPSSLDAMWCTLAACAAPASGVEDPSSRAPPPVIPLPSQAAAAGPATAATLPNDGIQPTDTSGSTTSRGGGAGAAAAVVDGLVLAFVSSRETELVHCVDLTVRCNPSRPQPDPFAASSGRAATDALEELDGWRGYFSPFSGGGRASTKGTAGATTTRAAGAGMAASPPPPPGASSAVGARADEGPPKIVGLAVCRTSSRQVHLACLAESDVAVWVDPHLHLSCRRPITPPSRPVEATTHSLPHGLSDGRGCAVDVRPGIVAVGMDTGAVLIYVYSPDTKQNSHLRLYLRIPPPPADGAQVVSVQLAIGTDRASVFCAYRLATASGGWSSSTTTTAAAAAAPASVSGPSAGVCCYEIPLPGRNPSAVLSAPSARHDLDGRYVSSQVLVDSAPSFPEAAAGAGVGGGSITVARPDGLYSYSRTERTGVAPIDGLKLAFCLVPSPVLGERPRHAPQASSSITAYASSNGCLSLVASTDVKSNRDAIDIYDSLNKLVAFHLLLSPGHRAIRAAAVATAPTVTADGSVRGGRSSAVVLTSGGALITLTEKLTQEKIALLVQKNLYSAAIVVAYADPSTDVSVITSLYRQYAEHLYRKGDFGGAIDQYCHTIGSLESSHVIFRYLDAPKIPLLVKYLEKLRTRGLATPVHNELLRTCYLKLNDTEAADAITASASGTVAKASMSSILSNLSSNPKEALATICSLEAPQASKILMVHGATLSRVLPRETAGVVVALCLGTYSPKALADAALIDPTTVKRIIERGTDDRPRVHEPYPFHLFSTCFLENPRMLRLILTHCNRNKCFLTGPLRRTLLELTLEEWNQAKRSGDVEAEKMRHKEALLALTDSHSREIGDYDALVIVQEAGFEEGELLLYERLQMTPLLLQRYAKDGTEKSRRQMLAMCQSDAEILADVLGHFVKIASEKINENHITTGDEEASDDDEADAILDDIREALSLARRQGVLPPVRIARILAGEGTGQFTAENPQETSSHRRTIPLSVALDYVGSLLEESRREIHRLRSGVEEYNQLCNNMESEIDSLLRASLSLPASQSDRKVQKAKLSIDDLYAKLRSEEPGNVDVSQEQPLESFWRDMGQSEDTFETISRYFAKGVIK